MRHLGRRQGGAAQHAGGVAAPAAADSSAGASAQPQAVTLPPLPQRQSGNSDSFSFAVWAPQNPEFDSMTLTAPPAAVTAPAPAAGARGTTAAKTGVLRARHFDPNAAPVTTVTTAVGGTTAKGQQQPNAPSAAAAGGWRASAPAGGSLWGAGAGAKGPAPPAAQPQAVAPRALPRASGHAPAANGAVQSPLLQAIMVQENTAPARGQEGDVGRSQAWPGQQQHMPVGSRSRHLR